MSKKKKLENALEFCLKISEELIYSFPTFGGEFLKKAGGCYEELDPDSKNYGKITMRLRKISDQYINLDKPIS